MTYLSYFRIVHLMTKDMILEENHNYTFICESHSNNYICNSCNWRLEQSSIIDTARGY